MTGSGRRWWRTGLAVVVACGVCCAAPLIGLLGSIGALSALGALFDGFEVVGPALAALAFGLAGLVWLRRRRRRTCRVPDRVVNLGLPEPIRRRR